MIDMLFRVFMYAGFVVLVAGSVYLLVEYFKIQKQIKRLENKNDQN